MNQMLLERLTQHKNHVIRDKIHGVHNKLMSDCMMSELRLRAVVPNRSRQSGKFMMQWIDLMERYV